MRPWLTIVILASYTILALLTLCFIAFILFSTLTH